MFITNQTIAINPEEWRQGVFKNILTPCLIDEAKRIHMSTCFSERGAECIATASPQSEKSSSAREEIRLPSLVAVGAAKDEEVAQGLAE